MASYRDRITEAAQKAQEAGSKTVTLDLSDVHWLLAALVIDDPSANSGPAVRALCDHLDAIIAAWAESGLHPRAVMGLPEELVDDLVAFWHHTPRTDLASEAKALVQRWRALNLLRRPVAKVGSQADATVSQAELIWGYFTKGVFIPCESEDLARARVELVPTRTLARRASVTAEVNS
jgi:hypothetical protein